MRLLKPVAKKPVVIEALEPPKTTKAKEEKPKKPAVKIDVRATIKEYVDLSSKIKELDSRKKELATRIKEYAESSLTKDSKGSYYGEADGYIYGSSAKKTITLDKAKAEELLKKMKLWKEVVDVVEVINEDKIAQLITEEKLTAKQLEEMTSISITMSVLVKEKESEKPAEEMPTIETKSKKKVK